MASSIPINQSPFSPSLLKRNLRHFGSASDNDGWERDFYHGYLARAEEDKRALLRLSQHADGRVLGKRLLHEEHGLRIERLALVGRKREFLLCLLTRYEGDLKLQLDFHLYFAGPSGTRKFLRRRGHVLFFKFGEL